MQRLLWTGRSAALTGGRRGLNSAVMASVWLASLLASLSGASER
jgi:hypothetical protein